MRKLSLGFLAWRLRRPKAASGGTQTQMRAVDISAALEDLSDDMRGKEGAYSRPKRYFLCMVSHIGR